MSNLKLVAGQAKILQSRGCCDTLQFFYSVGWETGPLAPKGGTKGGWFGKTSIRFTISAIGSRDSP
ncbi:hypothetical protein [Salegentibacter sp. T436]|uniref:hypothetical protein n=1 Tax=Salegentibacter sp. T436 TaxID=1729720 RepID=UPI00094A5D81|nr:hypothetical protein [Salegentibacter sp. T436]APS39792.1 hypothetical protein AO058_13285 [Salegentibacter sp. T436]